MFLQILGGKRNVHVSSNAWREEEVAFHYIDIGSYFFNSFFGLFAGDDEEIW